MKTINRTTKQASRLINSFFASKFGSLADCYKSYSTAKARAENACRRMMAQGNGYEFRILSFNTFGFTCGWLTEAGLRIETPAGSYFIPGEA